WTSPRGDIDGPDVYADCGESDGTHLSCTEGVTWKEAYDTCEVAGARLCTLNEIENNVPSGTGCNYDNHSIWSMTPCPGGFYSTRGSMPTASNKYCEDAESTTSGGG